MRADPRKACKNKEELWFWATIHDLLAHPFMALTMYSKLSLRFHDYTSEKAWPRNGGVMKKHPSHKTVVSLDASTYDEICERCGATDGVGGTLDKPCGGTPDDSPALPGWTITPAIDAFCRRMELACEYYEKSAPTVCDHCNDLFIRINEDSKLVTLAEMVGIEGLWREGYLQPNYAANHVYKLRLRLGMSVEGHAGY